MPASRYLKLFLCILALVSTVTLSAQSMCINEIQVANIDQYIDPSFNYGGWIEIYNPSKISVKLEGYVIRHTDNEGKVQESSLRQSHGIVPAKGYALVWFDHNSSQGSYGNDAATQIPFKLDADGGVIELLDSKYLPVDAVEYPASIARCSWTRVQDGASQFGWTAVPTPFASNATSVIATDRLMAPSVSTAGGVFTDSYRMKVDIPERCTLYYTTDGSTPIPGKSLISKDGSFVGSENVIYRLMLARDGYLNSPVVTRSFFKSEGKFSLPILSVNTAPDNFFDDTIGLYVTGTNGRYGNNSKVMANQNMDWERPVNVEYFVPDADMHYDEAINQEVSFSIFGGWTRFNVGNDDFEFRPSFKLKSDKVYEGDNSFTYSIFDCKPHIKVKSILVRNGGQDSKARIWDAAIHELIRTSGIYLDCQAWQPVQVYLDGKYLGLMNLREESNKQFAFSNYGIDKDEIDQWESDIVIKEGDKVKLNEWLELSKTLAISLNDTTIWNEICQLVDIDEYCNYMAAEIYMGNLDWLRGGFKNLKGFRARDDDGKFHIVMHDVDGGFGDTNMIIQVLGNGTGSLPVRFKNMLKYGPFRKQFIDAYCIMNGSVFDAERCKPIIMAMRDRMNPALQVEGLSADDKAQLLISRLSDDEVRRPALKESLKIAFELGDDYDVDLHSNFPVAKMLLNGQEIPTGRLRGYLFPPVTLTSLAPDGYTFQRWVVNGVSVSTDSVFNLSKEFPAGKYDIQAVYQYSKPRLAPVRINEVSAGNDIYINEYGKKTDWIELYNNSDRDYDLSGSYLSDDPNNRHKYQIPAYLDISTIVPAHGYKVVWCDGKESATQLHVPFKLKNEDGSFVSLTAPNDAWTDALVYQEQPRWHTYGRYPDGGQSVAMFERPTIDGANRICTSTSLIVSDDIANGIDDIVNEQSDSQIESVRYYNLQGLQIANIRAERVVIQRITYRDGTVKTRKLMLH